MSRRREEMKLEQELKNFEIRAKEIKTEIDDYLKRLRRQAKNTKAFLLECKIAGITGVAIETGHESIPPSMNFPFGVHGSVFSIAARDKNGWPAIWGVAEKCGLRDGCTNSNQAQIKSGELMEGVYHLKDGIWARISI